MLARPQRDGEHADEALDGALDAPLCECGQDDFGVAGAGERMAEAFEVGANFAEVIHLAVEHHGPATVGREHGLVAVRGQVEDRETTVAQTDTAVVRQPAPAVVGAAMVQRLDRTRQVGRP